MNTTKHNMDVRSFKNHEERRKAIEEQNEIILDSIGATFTDDTEKVHCENLIGAVALPLGVAGPVTINGSYVSGSYLLPLATTEGALVASVSRGAKAITKSGGTMVHIEHVGTTRGALFEVEHLKEGARFRAWLADNQSVLAKQAEATSRHLKLKQIDSVQNGRNVYVRFYYDTNDAMGMNMVTIATHTICEFIKNEKKINCLSVAGNYDIDKKPAWLNSISGRGRKGWAEVVLSKETVEKVLKTTPQALYNIVIKKCWGGSMMAGSLGFNAHFANIAAAFFVATGQDLAHVVETSQGITSAEVLENGNLYFSVYLPDIMLGTVGGGTKLKTQTEARSIIGVRKVEELTEVFVAAVLAGELSLLASLAENTLAKAHKQLGR